MYWILDEQSRKWGWERKAERDIAFCWLSARPAADTISVQMGNAPTASGRLSIIGHLFPDENPKKNIMSQARKSTSRKICAVAKQTPQKAEEEI